MLTITDLQFAFGTRTLFEGASAQLAKGWKVGLIGRNGTGKSTLLRLIREAHTTKEKDTAIRFNEGATLGWDLKNKNRRPKKKQKKLNRKKTKSKRARIVRN